MVWYRKVKPRKNGSGYVTVWMPNHQNANKCGQVYEHVLIASEALGKALPRGIEVHHVNGIGTDNRPENLVICENGAYHKLLHRRTKAFRACGDASAVQCYLCKQWGKSGVNGLTTRKNKPESYHLKCRAAAENAYRHLRNPELKNPPQPIPPIQISQFSRSVPCDRSALDQLRKTESE